MVNLPAEPGLTASHGRRRRVRLARRQRHIQVVSSDKLRNTLRDICPLTNTTFGCTRAMA